MAGHSKGTCFLLACAIAPPRKARSVPATWALGCHWGCWRMKMEEGLARLDVKILRGWQFTLSKRQAKVKTRGRIGQTRQVRNMGLIKIAISQFGWH